MATGYYRIELGHCLDIDEVARCMMAASGGQMIDFKPEEDKKTNGKVDKEGTHYSRHNWKGKVKMPRTASGRGRSKEIVIGITDYECMVRKKHCARQMGHRHFFAQGPNSAALQVVDIFKAVIPSTLWRDVEISAQVHDC